MVYYCDYEDYTMKTTVISVAGDVALKSGPVQFGENDWPGTFLTISYIKKNIKPAEAIKPENVLDADSFSKMYINSFYNNLVSQINDPLYDNIIIVDEITHDVQELNDIDIQFENKSMNRVETGFVTVNGQHGYFIRGDASAYVVYTLSLRSSLSDEESAFSELMSKSIVGGFQFKS